MKLEAFNYHLPKELIAQFPAQKRDHSRLMALNRKERSITHRIFSELPDYLNPGDLLVLNNTKVIPARLFGKKRTGGRVEVLLISHLGIQTPDVLNPISEIRNPQSNRWLCLINPSKGLKSGSHLSFDEGLSATLVQKDNDGRWVVEFSAQGDISALMERVGKMPLPPYIKRGDDNHSLDIVDRERYQTVFAKTEGAIAAPTAGLHFTKELLQKIQDRGVEILNITLHTGLGTFLPVKEDDITKHRMLPEYYSVDPEVCEAIKRAKKEKRRIVAVGSTALRALETIAQQGWKKSNLAGATDLFIYPGYKFQIVDVLLTNFHLPKSTLIMLVSAFAGRDFILRAYEEAVEKRYRFFSYGDAMLIE